ncbi:MAG: hypothetical protein AAFV53_10375 [Myxococcota bacterium]
MSPILFALFTSISPAQAVIPVVESPVTGESAAPDFTAAWESHLRAERQRRLNDLSTYAAAGQFPQKDGVPGWHHQFLDANDVPCAVASLIWTSGHEALVRTTAETQNDVILSELEAGPLVEWVLTSGLTMEEVAVIQEPGFEPDFVGIDILEPAMPIAELEEIQRVRDHLAAVHQLISVDTESSIAKAMARLGERVHTPPPIDSLAMTIGD